MTNMKSDILVPSRCRLCGALIDNVEVLTDIVYGGYPEQKFYHCDNCDIAFLFPAMTEEEERNFYSKEFEKFMERRSGGDLDWSGPEAHIKSNEGQYQRRLPFFDHWIAEGKRILEIGCSSGFMLLPLKDKGVDVVGIEPSGGFSSFLVNQGIRVYKSIEEFDSTVSEKKEFDLILHFFVLEHVRYPVEFLKHALKPLKPGGVMVFEVPNRSDPLLTIYNIPEFHKFYWSAAHNYYFNMKSLEYVLKQVADEFEIFPEQRYDISNHFSWALTGKPGGQRKYSSFFTDELETAYKNSMKKMGFCDTLIGRIYKMEDQ